LIISHNFFNNDKENHDIKLVFVSVAAAVEPMLARSADASNCSFVKIS